MTPFSVVLFDGFETLDAFGPVEVIGQLDRHYALGYFSLAGRVVRSSQGVRVETQPLADLPEDGVMLIPGGMGTRTEVDNTALIGRLRSLALHSRFVLTVCTGSALLARTGLLDGLPATTNKLAFDWVTAQGPKVLWRKQARWVQADRFYTSSGVSAGIDMALGFVADQVSPELAERIARGIEYTWHRDRDADPFAIA